MLPYDAHCLWKPFSCLGEEIAQARTAKACATVGDVCSKPLSPQVPHKTFGRKIIRVVLFSNYSRLASNFSISFLARNSIDRRGASEGDLSIAGLNAKTWSIQWAQKAPRVVMRQQFF